MTEYLDFSVADLARATLFIHHIKPSFKTHFVHGVEKPGPSDQSLVFHLTNTEDKTNDDVVILSAEFIRDHQYWKSLQK